MRKCYMTYNADSIYTIYMYILEHMPTSNISIYRNATSIGYILQYNILIVVCKTLSFNLLAYIYYLHIYLDELNSI